MASYQSNQWSNCRYFAKKAKESEDFNKVIAAENAEAEGAQAHIREITNRFGTAQTYS